MGVDEQRQSMQWERNRRIRAVDRVVGEGQQGSIVLSGDTVDGVVDCG